MLKTIRLARQATRIQPIFNSRWLNTSTISAERDVYLEMLDGPSTGIGVLNLNRPKAKNAISVKFLQELREALKEARFSSVTPRVLILRSLVDGVFCAGADLKERAGMSPPQVTEFLYNLRQTYRDLESLPIPTIAVIDGAALGGGLEMALSCDLRVAGAKAKIGLPETRLAIIPGAGGTQRLPRLIGAAKAKELIFTSASLSAQSAYDYGIVNYATEDSSYPKALSLAQSMLLQGPIAMRMAKQAIDKGLQTDIDTGLEIEQAYYAQVIPTEDRMEGLMAFREKRTPVYKGK
ncbi:ClpP/crotonase-like domain-containing protein [Umbelopsis sp. PMI_123]|nr:ClpP/crotonase-like domain-containing protein [Umbelopsis sp. PMI_123]